MDNVKKYTSLGGDIIIYHYIEDDDYKLELWGGSTKHPDSVFWFSSFLKSEFIDSKYQVFQWLLECASKLNFPFHAKKLAEYALENWYNW